MKRAIPEEGQESVWDYPRPPRLEAFEKAISVEFGGETIAKTTHAQRVLETSHPPTYYLPLEAVREGVLLPTDNTTFCEWKGVARYFHVTVGKFKAENAAWAYHRPTAAFDAIRDHVAFYAHLMDACYVEAERVQSQLGGFYGGWITSKVVGPFKGQPGTRGW
jgi:uncharacterized protein (DUF427 family)